LEIEVTSFGASPGLNRLRKTRLARKIAPHSPSTNTPDPSFTHPARPIFQVPCSRRSGPRSGFDEERSSQHRRPKTREACEPQITIA